ncbi:MAG: hypothetical protein U0V70_03020 [Terriglobia bacterium]
MKFSGPFGILEANVTPLLPVTVRNVEPKIGGQILEVEEGKKTIQHSDINQKNQYLSEEMRGMTAKSSRTVPFRFSIG